MCNSCSDESMFKVKFEFDKIYMKLSETHKQYSMKEVRNKNQRLKGDFGFLSNIPGS